LPELVYFRQSFVLRHGGDPMTKKTELPCAALWEFSRLAAADRAARRDPSRAEELILLGRKPN
jgi:hypothetical protein